MQFIIRFEEEVDETRLTLKSEETIPFDIQDCTRVVLMKMSVGTPLVSPLVYVSRTTANRHSNMNLQEILKLQNWISNLQSSFCTQLSFWLNTFWTTCE